MEEIKDDEAWQWSEPDDEVPLDKLLKTTLLPHLNQWRVSTDADLDHSLLIPLSNWIVNNIMPKEIACTRIKMSGIPKAGYGLWATRNILEGQYITVYGGLYYPSKEDFRNQTGKGPDNRQFRYVMGLSSGAYINGELGFMLWEQGRWANTQRTKEECNAEFEEKTDTEGGYWQVRLKATHSIGQGQEIFAWYSTGYVDTHLNKKHCVQCRIQDAVTKVKDDPHLQFCGADCALEYFKHI